MIREDIHVLSRYAACTCEKLGLLVASGSSSSAFLETIATNTTRENWNTVVGNTVTFSYYAGIAGGNPSGNTSNVETAVYSNGAGTAFTNTFTYDANDNILTIVTS